MSIQQVAATAGDVVDTWRQAEGASMPPLIVIEGLEPIIPGSGPIAVEKLGSGHSNETFRITREGQQMVLRRPPRPPLPPGAHDIVREASVLGALVEEKVRAPKPLLVHADSGAIGAPFYLMELVPGLVIRDRMPAELDDPAGRRGVVSEFVDALVEVHAVPWRGSRFEQIGRSGGYLDRQLQRWSRQWEHNRTRPVPEIDEIRDWLVAERPRNEETTIVHGDAKLDNAIYDHGKPASLAVLVDWEMATLGDPLADLGLLCGTYVEPDEDPDPVFGFSPVTNAKGSPRREEIATWYAERSGRPVDALAWYEILAVWKIMVLLEGSYRRHLAGTTADPLFALLGEGIPRMAAKTWARIEAGR